MDWSNTLVFLVILTFVAAAVAAAPAKQLSADHIMAVGLKRAGITTKMQSRVNKKRNIRRFKSHFGATPEVLVALWDALQNTSNRQARIRPWHMDLHWFLTTVHFLKTYKTEDELEAFSKVSDLKQTRAWVWWYIGKIAKLKGEKVRSSPSTRKSD